MVKQVRIVENLVQVDARRKGSNAQPSARDVTLEVGVREHDDLVAARRELAPDRKKREDVTPGTARRKADPHHEV